MSIQTTSIADVTNLVSGALQVEVPLASGDLIESNLMDSLGLVNVLAALEDQYGITVTLDDLELSNFRTVEALARFIGQRLGK
jgi:acyl carrier protein